MKRVFSKYFIAIIVFAVTVGFSACSSDDDDDNPKSDKLSEFLVGTYEGKVQTVKGTVNATMKVTATGDNSVKIEFVGDRPEGTAESVSTNLRVADSNTIIGTAATVVNLLYYKDVKNLTCQHTGGDVIYSFQGTKK
ncbi:MAG: hypothetical protein LBU84_04285 [Prevotella sp.]|jgi:hypothetical protein|nr:hypothetical protein [Prevotella sp.]